MKIEIDLNDILGDEFGAETLQDSVKRQVVEKMSREIQSGIGKKIDAEIAKHITSTIQKNLEEVTPKLFNDLMDAEYTPVDRYGDRQREKTTTFRKELVKGIHENMTYNKAYNSNDRNVFTKLVDAVIEQNVSIFKKDFNTLVNEQFTKECLEYATAKLRERLGIK